MKAWIDTVQKEKDTGEKKSIRKFINNNNDNDNNKNKAGKHPVYSYALKDFFLG